MTPTSLLDITIYSAMLTAKRSRTNIKSPIINPRTLTSGKNSTRTQIVRSHCVFNLTSVLIKSCSACRLQRTFQANPQRLQIQKLRRPHLEHPLRSHPSESSLFFPFTSIPSPNHQHHPLILIPGHRPPKRTLRQPPKHPRPRLDLRHRHPYPRRLPTQPRHCHNDGRHPRRRRAWRAAS